MLPPLKSSPLLPISMGKGEVVSDIILRGLSGYRNHAVYRCTKRPAGGLEEGIVWVLLHRPLSGLTVWIASRKNANSFYVAAVVKPLFPFFPSLASFLEELCHI